MPTYFIGHDVRKLFTELYQKSHTGLVIFRGILNNGTPNFVNVMIIISPVRYYAPALPALALICAAGFAAIKLPRLPSAGVAAGAFIAACWLVVSAAKLSVPVNNDQLRSNAVMSQAEYHPLSGPLYKPCSPPISHVF